jgi:hypothetical protein
MSTDRALSFSDRRFLVSSQAPSELVVPPAKTKSFLLELVWAAIRHDLDAAAVASGANAALAKTADEKNLDALLTDVVWFVSLAVESDARLRVKLAELANALSRERTSHHETEL